MSHRTQITLTESQYRKLLNMSVERGQSISELIRRAVDQAYGQQDTDRLTAALEDSFGAWDWLEVDGEQYVDRLRRGMAQRLEHDR